MRLPVYHKENISFTLSNFSCSFIKLFAMIGDFPELWSVSKNSCVSLQNLFKKRKRVALIGQQNVSLFEDFCLDD